jgi:hypothetical protein
LRPVDFLPQHIVSPLIVHSGHYILFLEHFPLPFWGRKDMHTLKTKGFQNGTNKKVRESVQERECSDQNVLSKERQCAAISKSSWADAGSGT